MVFAGSVAAQAVMALGQYAFSLRAPQHRDDVRRPEQLFRQLDAGKKLLRCLGDVCRLTVRRVLAAIVTTATGWIESLTEIRKERHAPAIARLHESHQGLEASRSSRT